MIGSLSAVRDQMLTSPHAAQRSQGRVGMTEPARLTLNRVHGLRAVCLTNWRDELPRHPTSAIPSHLGVIQPHLAKILAPAGERRKLTKRVLSAFALPRMVSAAPASR